VTILPPPDTASPRQQRAEYLANLLQATAELGASRDRSAGSSALSPSALNDLALLQFLANTGRNEADFDSAAIGPRRYRRR
jgi:hypothetical protein